jgi:nucleoside-diphosphate-sugar epimerase
MAGDKVVVTGGAGMIGSNLVKRLVHLGNDVFVIDNLWRGRLEYLCDDQGRSVIDLDKNFYHLDLKNAGTFEEIFQDADIVFHLADVVAGIDYVFSNEGSIFRENLLINSNVIAAIREIELKGFIYVGTACSYPSAMQQSVDGPLLREEDAYPAWPESAYGWSKLMGEYETELIEQETELPVSILRLHNVYGSPCDYEAVRGQVIPSLIRKAINYPGDPFIVWGSGGQGRAFAHVDDVVDALILAMQRGLGQGVIQIGPDVCTTIREIAEIIDRLSGKNIDIQYDTSKPEGDRGRAADFSKARSVLGWTPRVPLEEGISKVYQWIEADIRSND